MDCIFKITSAVKKIGFVVLLAELAVIAYMSLKDIIISIREVINQLHQKYTFLVQKSLSAPLKGFVKAFLLYITDSPHFYNARNTDKKTSILKTETEFI